MKLSFFLALSQSTVTAFIMDPAVEVYFKEKTRKILVHFTKSEMPMAAFQRRAYSFAPPKTVSYDKNDFFSRFGQIN